MRDMNAPPPPVYRGAFGTLKNRRLAAIAAPLLMASSLGGQTSVLTRSYNNARTGANIKESVMTPAKVLSQGLTKAFSLSVSADDPRIEAQPLYVPGELMSDGARHDVI
jgi:hypothetical protein